MSSMCNRIVAGLMAGALAGCISFGNVEPQRYYVLEDRNAASAAAPEQDRQADATLLVSPTQAPSFYDTQEIVYSPSAGLRARYQFHSWTERPGKSLGELLLARLARTPGLGTVASSTSGVKGELLLNTTLAEFYHDAATPPGTARVVLNAELVDRGRRVLVARRSFERVVAAQTYDAPGAVQALNQAVTGMLDDIDSWLADEVDKLRR